MKTRTRVCAWVALGAWVVCGLPLVFSVLHPGAQVYMNVGRVPVRPHLPGYLVLPVLAGWVGPPVGWLALLAGQTWGWRLLIVVYGAWALALARPLGGLALPGWGGVLYVPLVVLPLLFLLTDRPRGWRAPAAADQAEAKHTRKRRRGPTLIEVLIIVAILGIVMSIVGSARGRRRPARHNRNTSARVSHTACPGAAAGRTHLAALGGACVPLSQRERAGLSHVICPKPQMTLSS